jgi:toxin-antitoxin system PIN domain toxin
MIIPDVNLLLYGANRQSPFHSASRTWWQGALQGTSQIGLCEPVIFGYVRVSTHPKIFAHPLSPEEAFSHVENWMGFSTVQWLIPDDSHLARVKALLLKASAGGDLVTDAQIAAYGQQYNGTICSADLDFSRFRVKWLNPLAPNKAA